MLKYNINSIFCVWMKVSFDTKFINIKHYVITPSQMAVFEEVIIKTGQHNFPHSPLLLIGGEIYLIST